LKATDILQKLDWKEGGGFVLNNPEFIVYTGPMFSSKTSRLLFTLEKYKYQHRKIVVFKPQIDDRYSTDEVVTHGGWRTSAICVKTGADVLECLANSQENPNVIAVDEAFMIPGIAETLVWLYHRGFTVVVSSLELSYSGKSFSEIEKMLTWATKIEKCTAVCTVCGYDAHYTHKKQTGGEEIEVGGAELYEPRCARHFPVVFNVTT
jgi:thymidine kinase